jgi:general secretion pathway protein E
LEHGLILVTGPTGGGKSTTLYAALQEINMLSSNVVTLEDPIEYQLDGISQTQVNEKKGMTFASGLRNVLRQDPDIIMIGEIRDRETAEMAIPSALTGHMVFSTLHTNDAASAVTRLLDLGIEPFLVASSVIGVLSQRLVRKTCQKCNGAAGGCESCRHTGFHGRVGVFELMIVNESVRELIQKRPNASLIKGAACKNGMQTLSQDGQRKVGQGLTTKNEILRITMQIE